MDRRRFLELLGMATAGSVVAYSFPSIIVPKNIDLIDQINSVTIKEIFPKRIDGFFRESNFLAYLRGPATIFDILDEEMAGATAILEKAKYKWAL